MADKWMTEIVSIGVAIVGLALVAVIVGKNAQTAKVLGAAGTALSDTIKAAVSPAI